MIGLLQTEQAQYWAYCLSTKRPASFYEWKHKTGRCSPAWKTYWEQRNWDVLVELLDIGHQEMNP